MKTRDFLLFTCLILFAGCDSDVDNLSGVSEKEREISEDVIYCATEEDFMATMLSEVSIPEDVWVFSSPQTKAAGDVVKHTVVGYDRVEHGKYTKYLLGTWATKYGLAPNTIYLVAEAQCYKNLPCASNDAFTERNYGNVEDPMGWIPGMVVDNKYVKGFKFGSYNPLGYREGQTFIKHVGWDILGREINVYYPFKPQQLVWYYQTSPIPDWN